MNEINDNKRMTLDDARIELERQGLLCDWINDHMLAGVSSNCYWDLMAKLDHMVFVQQVPGHLTLDRLFADLKLVPFWVEQQEQQRKLSGTCPPFGFSRGRQVILVYYADTVAQEVVYEITQRPREREWCAGKFLAAQDATGRSYTLSEARTPFWGSAFFPDLRYRAKKLTGCPVEETKPPGLPCWIRCVNIFSLMYLVYISFITPWIVLFVVGIMLLHFLIAAIVQWCKNRKQKQKVDRENLLEIEGGGFVDIQEVP
jgi:hypothetical protein